MSQLLSLFPGVAEKHYFQDTETKEFWFHATAVCKELGFENPSRSLQMYTDEDERFQEIYQGRSVWFVSEAGCYGLAMAAKTEQAKKFKRWLKHDVLPKLRETGLYADESRFSKSEYQRIQEVIKERDNRITQLEKQNNLLSSEVGYYKAEYGDTQEKREYDRRLIIQCQLLYKHVSGDIWRKTRIEAERTLYK
jgi:prophage antirepressor-like protein